MRQNDAWARSFPCYNFSMTRLNTEAARALRMPDVRERLAGLGMNVIGGIPDAFATFFKADIAKWADVIRR